MPTIKILCSKSKSWTTTHPASEYTGSSTHRCLKVLLNCPKGQQVLAPSLQNQELESQTATAIDLEEEHGPTSSLSTHAKPKVGARRLSKSTLRGVFGSFQDVKPSHEASSGGNSASKILEATSGRKPLNIPIINEGRHFMSLQTELPSHLQTAQDDSSQEEAISASLIIERRDLRPEEEESLRAESAQFFIPLKKFAVGYSQNSSIRTLASFNGDNDDIELRSLNPGSGSGAQDPRSHDHTQEGRCHCHSCKLYPNRGTKVGRYKVSMYCKCDTCVQHRLREITTERMTDRNARREGFCCSGKIWGTVKERLKNRRRGWQEGESLGVKKW
ncbi:hypothetical protein OIDMADRAFT_55489 [Oidiodendron maius Zn]|uniref:Uncharacterized protein n=1 Tax=Oidiodendron maius (strain Zn) TaxID=913774 RepID=A0A0C3HB49_OIDMZ|nr:hypothetical protein OIDMADRAFT_55489 [Oidiodendron maius Zn]